MEFYRYTDSHDAYGYAHIELSLYVLLRETPCGYWIAPKWAVNRCSITKEKYKKWISKDSKKRFAYPTKKEALQNFEKRKLRQIWWGEYNTERAKSALSELSSIREKLEG
jgi:hypothetical protein